MIFPGHISFYLEIIGITDSFIIMNKALSYSSVPFISL